jgi:hypothetical protein
MVRFVNYSIYFIKFQDFGNLILQFDLELLVIVKVLHPNKNKYVILFNTNLGSANNFLVLKLFPNYA